jgi:hypothetical protein
VQQQQQPQKKGQTWNVVFAVIRGWSATIYPFLRKNIGKNHPGLTGLIGLGWVLLWVAYTHANGLLWLIPLYGLGQLSHSLGHARKRSPLHTNYSGEPLVAMKLLRFRDESAAKRFGEPLISLAFGIALLAYGYYEGKYFVFGAAALAANQTLIDQYDRRRVDSMRDAMIEGRYLLNQVKGKT